MSALRVGQKVRVVANFDAGCRGAPIGSESVITGDLGWWPWERKTGRTEIFAYLLAGDWFARPGEIEPIQYDGRELVAWSDCAWQPEHMRAPA